LKGNNLYKPLEFIDKKLFCASNVFDQIPIYHVNHALAQKNERYFSKKRKVKRIPILLVG